jgi:hypothetical protein
LPLSHPSRFSFWGQLDSEPISAAQNWIDIE